jgi:hypothetical protein
MCGSVCENSEMMFLKSCDRCGTALIGITYQVTISKKVPGQKTYSVLERRTYCERCWQEKNND